MPFIMVLVALMSSASFAQVLTPAQEKEAETFADVLRPRGSRAGFLLIEDRAVPLHEFIGQVATKLYGNQTYAYVMDMSAFQNEFDINLLFGLPPGFVGSDRPTPFEDFLRTTSQFNGTLIVFYNLEDGKILKALQDRIYPKIFAGEYSRHGIKIDLTKFTFLFAAEQEFVVSDANGVKNHFASLKGMSAYHKNNAAQKLTYAAVEKQKFKNFIPCKDHLENP